MSESHRIYDEVTQYFLDNPDATWYDAFRDVENHYAHTASMRTAMRNLEKRREWREKYPSRENKDNRNGFLFNDWDIWLR